MSYRVVKDEDSIFPWAVRAEDGSTESHGIDREAAQEYADWLNDPDREEKLERQRDRQNKLVSGDYDDLEVTA